MLRDVLALAEAFLSEARLLEAALILFDLLESCAAFLFLRNMICGYLLSVQYSG